MSGIGFVTLISVMSIILVILAWVGLKETDRLNLRHVGAGLFIILAAISVNGTFYTIDSGERGVLLTWGDASMSSIGPGLHVKIPGMQTVDRYEVRTLKYESKATAASKDLQTVSTTVAVNYHLNPSMVPKVHVELGHNYDDRVIQPAVQEVVKASTAKYSAEQLVTDRSSVKDLIQKSLYDRLFTYGIIVESIAITDFSFSQAFKDAVEAKVTASQQKQKADMDLKRVEVEAQMQIEKAKAEAEALKLQKAAVTPELLELRKIEMQSKAIDKWDGKMPQFTGSSAIPFIDVGILE